LIERKSEKAAAAMTPFLNDPDVEVVHSAIALVHVNKSKEAVPELIRLLDHESSSIRVRAVNALAEIEGKAAGQYLMTALDDRNPRVKTIAAYHLCRLDYAEAQEKIVRMMLEDPVKHTRLSMASSLGSMKSAPACDALMPMLSASDKRSLEIAIHSLGELRCEEAVGPLYALLKSNPKQAQQIVRSLVQIGGPEAIAAFRNLYEEAIPGSAMKAEAAAALAELGDPTGIPYLRNGNIPNSDIAIRLARAGDYGAVSTLIKMTEKERWPPDRYTYGKVLEELTGKRYGWDTRRWKRWWTKNKDELLQEMLSGNVYKGGN
jgi:HEAT repeat protein